MDVGTGGREADSCAEYWNSDMAYLWLYFSIYISLTYLHNPYLIVLPEPWEFMRQWWLVGKDEVVVKLLLSFTWRCKRAPKYTPVTNPKKTHSLSKHTYTEHASWRGIVRKRKLIGGVENMRGPREDNEG